MINKRGLRKCIVPMIMVFVLGCVGVSKAPLKAYAEEKDVEYSIIDQQTQTNEVKNIEEQLERYKNERLDDILPGYDPENMINDMAKGKFDFDVPGWQTDF